jgi:hypothetical protein
MTEGNEYHYLTVSGYTINVLLNWCRTIYRVFTRKVQMGLFQVSLKLQIFTLYGYGNYVRKFMWQLCG